MDDDLCAAYLIKMLLAIQEIEKSGPGNNFGLKDMVETELK
jgi:hypothetical protein